MAAPTFVQEAETTWTASTSNKTTASFNVTAGDLLVALMAADTVSAATSLTASGGSLTWTQQITVGATTEAFVVISTAVASTTTSITATVTKGSGASVIFGMNVLTFRDVDAATPVGAKASTKGTTGAPSVSITAQQANSAIVVFINDTLAVDGASRVWLTNAGALTEQTYNRGINVLTVYGGFHADAGAAGADTVGLSAPSSGMTWSMGALEVRGIVSAGGIVYPQLERMIRGLTRGIR